MRERLGYLFIWKFVNYNLQMNLHRVRRKSGKKIDSPSLAFVVVYTTVLIAVLESRWNSRNIQWIRTCEIMNKVKVYSDKLSLHFSFSLCIILDMVRSRNRTNFISSSQLSWPLWKYTFLTIRIRPQFNQVNR